jgi:hypothetical protein
MCAFYLEVVFYTFTVHINKILKKARGPICLLNDVATSQRRKIVLDAVNHRIVIVFDDVVFIGRIESEFRAELLVELVWRDVAELLLEGFLVGYHLGLRFGDDLLR